MVGPSGPQAARLADHFTVYTYDRHGRGESGDTQPYAVEHEIEDLAAVIGAAGSPARIPRLAMCEPPYSVQP